DAEDTEETQRTQRMRLIVKDNLNRLQPHAEIVTCPPRNMLLKKLDWYILKKFIFTTFFILLMMSLIACVIDASEKTDDFVKAGVSTYQIITEYYTGFVSFTISLIL